MVRRALGRDARLSRRLAWTTVALVAIYGGALAYVVFFAVLWGRESPGAVAWIVLLPVVVFVAALDPYRTALRLSGAALAGPEEEPRLHGALERLCALADVPKPRLAVSEEDVPEAFTVGVRPGGSVIVVTRGLLERLEPPEVEAVLAHELAHIVNRDGALMTAASFPLFAGAWLFQRLQQKPALWLLLILFLPYALAGVTLHFVCGALTRSLAMYRELAADRGAAVLTGAPEALASALQKLADAVPLIPQEDLRRVAPLDAVFIVAVDSLSRMHPPVQERIAQLAEIGRREGEAEPPPTRPHLGLAAAVFAVVFVAMLVVFLRA
jgi:heat shock protein HtpX